MLVSCALEGLPREDSDIRDDDIARGRTDTNSCFLRLASWLAGWLTELLAGSAWHDDNVFCRWSQCCHPTTAVFLFTIGENGLVIACKVAETGSFTYKGAGHHSWQARGSSLQKVTL